jgi:allophanate hydrolase subunit 2
MLLGNQDRFAPGWEMTLMGARFKADEPVSVVVIGAAGEQWVDGAPVPTAAVVHLEAGATLVIGPALQGLRRYCCWAVGHRPTGQRPAWEALSDWAPDRGWLRVLPGPEFERLESVDWVGPWRVDQRSDGRGLRLLGAHMPISDPDLWSSPVVDGTVQASASGPLLLLRQRPCLGGYARVLTVIPCDVDIAAQRRPGESIRFELVDEATARAAGLAQRRAVERCSLSTT